MISWLLSCKFQRPQSRAKALPELFLACCESGAIPVVEWFVETYRVDSKLAITLLLNIRKCSKGYVDITDRDILNFSSVCAAGHVEMLDYIEKHFFPNETSIREFYSKVVPAGNREVTAVIVAAFERTCRSGQLASAKWLWERINPQTINLTKADYLLPICERGHLEVLRWLLETAMHHVITSITPLTIKKLLKDRYANPHDCGNHEHLDIYYHCDVVDYLLEMLRSLDEQEWKAQAVHAYKSVLERQQLPPLRWITNSMIFDPNNQAIYRSLKFHCKAGRGCFIKRLLAAFFSQISAKTFTPKQRIEMWIAVCNADLNCMRLFAEKFEIARDDIVAKKLMAFATVCANPEDSELEAAEWCQKKFGLTSAEITTAMATLASSFTVKPNRWMILEKRFKFSRWEVLKLACTCKEENEGGGEEDEDESEEDEA